MKKVVDRGEAAADRHPGADLDDAADLPPVPVLDLAEGDGVRRQAVARPSDAAQFRRSCSASSTTTSSTSGCRSWNSLLIAVAVGVLTLLVATCAAFAISRLKVARRPHGDEPRAVHLLHPGGVPRRADVQGDGRLRPAQQPVGADPRDGHDRLAVRDLGAEAGVGQAAVRARRGGAHRRRVAAAALPAGLPAADDAVAGRRSAPTRCCSRGTSTCTRSCCCRTTSDITLGRRARPLPRPPTIRRGSC